MQLYNKTRCHKFTYCKFTLGSTFFQPIQWPFAGMCENYYLKYVTMFKIWHSIKYLIYKFRHVVSYYICMICTWNIHINVPTFIHAHMCTRVLNICLHMKPFPVFSCSVYITPCIRKYVYPHTFACLCVHSEAVRYAGYNWNISLNISYCKHFKVIVNRSLELLLSIGRNGWKQARLQIKRFNFNL
jgi:hypothetical protein